MLRIQTTSENFQIFCLPMQNVQHFMFNIDRKAWILRESNEWGRHGTDTIDVQSQVKRSKKKLLWTVDARRNQVIKDTFDSEKWLRAKRSEMKEEPKKTSSKTQRNYETGKATREELKVEIESVWELLLCPHKKSLDCGFFLRSVPCAASAKTIRINFSPRFFEIINFVAFGRE